jgi:glycosyltransferase involved in cell wall biosynthesis
VSPPRVSLLLPNHDNEHILGHVLDRLAANTTYPDAELVVVDDGSTDASREILRAWRDSGAFPGDVRLIEKANSGAIDTLNTALHAAGGELCVQLDSDASIETRGWIEPMLGLMRTDERVGVVTAKVVLDTGMLHACGMNLVGPAGAHDRPAHVREPIGRRRWHHRIERVREGAGGDAERLIAEVDAGIGCCMMYRRADALAAGGYDTGFSPVWFDDLDLCLSIRRLGRKAFYLPDVRVVHHYGGRRGRRGPAHYLQPARVGRALVRTAAARLPARARDHLERRLDADLDLRHTRAQRERLRHHYRYWSEKWGWDFLNPDMAEVQRRWAGTEICWASDPERRAAGEAIVRAYEGARREVPA